MKCFLLLISLLMFSDFSQADHWPYDPLCVHHGGRSEVFLINGGDHEQIVLCQFGFESYVDTESIWNSEVGIHSAAVLNYSLNESYPVGHTCSFAGAQVVRARTTSGRRYDLCVFFDGSVMEAQTFENGPGSYFNREMDIALGLVL
ncbi:MAG: hypothetical protein ACAH59_09470 [Pseudobdellovibrionaceae bacterium]